MAVGASMLGILTIGNGYPPVTFAGGGACLLAVALLRRVDLQQHGLFLDVLDGAATVAAPLERGLPPAPRAIPAAVQGRSFASPSE